MSLSRRRTLLVINPNGSTAMTETIKSAVDRYTGPDTLNTYWTCPDGLPALKTQEDIDRSTEACLQSLTSIVGQYDAFLLACYADHPLVAALQAQVGEKPVMGIFEASVAAALEVLRPARRFAILTTGKAYEGQLETGVLRLLRKDKSISCFAGVVSTGIGVEDLREGSEETLTQKMEHGVRKLLDIDHLGVICVGGVILSGTEDWVREMAKGRADGEAGGNIVVIDQLQAGVSMVEKLMQKKQT